MTNAVSLAQQASTGVSQGFKNRIINGAMVIDQRNAGASVSIASGGNPFTLDRFRSDNSTDGAITVQRVTDAPTGFVNSMKYTVTTADSSLASNQYLGLNHFIEGFNTADLMWGTANAKTITISFWVKSSITGNYPVSLDNNAASRYYIGQYSISSANTWEYKTVTIAGDTSGTWNTDNQRGVTVRWFLGSGSGLEGTVNSWQSGSRYSFSGAASVIGTLNATWSITGVQFEVGSSATSFEYRSIGTETGLCYRYYYRLVVNPLDPICTAAGYNTGSSISFGVVPFPVTMRTAPDIDQSSLASQFSMAGGGTSQLFTSFAYNERGTNTITLYNANNLSITTGYAYWFRSNSGAGTGQRLAFTAEL